MARSIRTATQPGAPSLTGEERHWVFGYGSLAHVENLRDFLARHRAELGSHSHTELIGFERTWSVAMDNSETLTGYKYFVDAETGARPAFIAFANIESRPGARVAGILFEVAHSTLAVLDTRERNYHRTDVTAHVSVAVEGTVWTYLGRPEASARFHEGREKNALVIDAAYAQAIATAFAEADIPYDPAHPPGVPLRALKRVDT